MDSAIIGAIITSSTTIIVGLGVGFFGNSRLEKLKSEIGLKAQHEIEYMKRKREIYEELCSGLQFIVSGRIQDNEKSSYRKQACEAYDKLSLWGSDNVCKAADLLFKALTEKNSEEEIKENYKQLLKSIREDLNKESNYERDYQFIS